MLLSLAEHMHTTSQTKILYHTVEWCCKHIGKREKVKMGLDMIYTVV
jgi:hypothetical protein